MYDLLKEYLGYECEVTFKGGDYEVFEGVLEKLTDTSATISIDEESKKVKTTSKLIFNFNEIRYIKFNNVGYRNV